MVLAQMSLFSLVDGAGGVKGQSDSHLAVDSDRQRHRGPAAVGPDHLRTVEGSDWIRSLDSFGTQGVRGTLSE